MTDIRLYLARKPWWTSRYMWGVATAEALVLDAIWHSRFSFAAMQRMSLEECLA